MTRLNSQPDDITEAVYVINVQNANNESGFHFWIKQMQYTSELALAYLRTREITQTH